MSQNGKETQKTSIWDDITQPYIEMCKSLRKLSTADSIGRAINKMHCACAMLKFRCEELITTVFCVCVHITSG